MDWGEFFEYKPNPTIESFGPNSTIKSGNTNITVNGKNLNSVSNPRIQVTAVSDFNRHHSIQVEGQCWVNPSGTQMTCQTPSLSRTNPPIDYSVSKDTQLVFIMDGVTNTGLSNRFSRLIYFRDPVFHHFDKGVQQVWYEEPDLTINGKDLRISYPIDIRISEHYIPCNITKSNTFDAIKCRIYDINRKIWAVDDRQHPVTIKVGNISFM
jgi:hypothetical protein